MGTATKPLITALQNKARMGIERGETDADTKQRGSRDDTVESGCFPRLSPHFQHCASPKA